MRRAVQPNEPLGSGVTISEQGRPLSLLDLQVFAPGPTKEASPSPGPLGPHLPRISDSSGTGMIASTQSAPASSGVSPPAPQLQGSEGFSSRPSQGVARLLSCDHEADLGTVGGRDRHSSCTTLLSFLMLFDQLLWFYNKCALFLKWFIIFSKGGESVV